MTDSYEKTEELVLIQVKKNRPWKVILAVVCVVIIAGLVAFFVLSQRSASRYEKAIALGDKALQEEDYDAAIVAYQKTIKIDPKKPEPYIHLSEAYLAKGDVDKAKETISEGEKNTEGNFDDQKDAIGGYVSAADCDADTLQKDTMAENGILEEGGAGTWSIFCGMLDPADYKDPKTIDISFRQKGADGTSTIRFGFTTYRFRDEEAEEVTDCDSSRTDLFDHNQFEILRKKIDGVTYFAIQSSQVTNNGHRNAIEILKADGDEISLDYSMEANGFTSAATYSMAWVENGEVIEEYENFTEDGGSPYDDTAKEKEAAVQKRFQKGLDPYGIDYAEVMTAHDDNEEDPWEQSGWTHLRSMEIERDDMDASFLNYSLS